MKRWNHLLTALPTLALLAGCGGERDQSAGISAASVHEIPVTTSSGEALTLFMEGQHALDMGRLEDATDLFKQAVGKDPHFAYAYVNLAGAANSAEEYMTALNAAEGTVRSASAGEQLLVKIARTFVDVDAGERLKLARELVDAYPNSPRAWITLANVQSALNETAQARTSLEEALKLDADFAPTHINLGLSYLFSEPKDFAKAEGHMKRVVELEPDEASAHVNLGDAYRARNMLDQARDAYAKGAEVDPASGLALSKKGHANSFIGNFDEARSDFDRAIEVGAGATKAAYANFRAFVHAYAGDPKAAVDELDRVAKAIPTMGIPTQQILTANINVAVAQARIALHHGMLDVAERALKRNAEQTRKNAQIVGDDDFIRAQEANIAWWAGELAARKGDYATARMKADEVARLVEPQTNPRKMEGYHALMGLTDLLQRNYQEAVDHFRQSDPNEIYTKYHLALALEGAGQGEEARRLFQEVATWNFNNAAYACIRKDAIARAGGTRA